MFARPALLTLAILVTGACASEATDGAAGTPTSVVDSDADGTTTILTEVPTTPAPTLPPAPTVFSPDPRAAIDQLINAWRFDNRTGALLVADATSVNNLFTQSADGFDLYGCDSGEFLTSNCNFRNRSTGGYAQITAEKLEQGWQVTSVYMSTDG